MTQILLYRCDKGIVLASDSRAVAFSPDERGSPGDDEEDSLRQGAVGPRKEDEEGPRRKDEQPSRPEADQPVRREMEVRKLFPLTADLIMVTAGAGVGILLCREFQARARRSGLHDFDAVAGGALQFMPSRLAEYRLSANRGAMPSELDRVYVLIAGYDPDGAGGPFPLLMLASETSIDPLHPVQMPDIITIPRQLTLEHRLAKSLPSQNRLDEVEHQFETFLIRLAASDDDVGPPFHFVRIGVDGVKIRTLADSA